MKAQHQPTSSHVKNNSKHTQIVLSTHKLFPLDRVCRQECSQQRQVCRQHRGGQAFNAPSSPVCPRSRSRPCRCFISRHGQPEGHIGPRTVLHHWDHTRILASEKHQPWGGVKYRRSILVKVPCSSAPPPGSLHDVRSAWYITSLDEPDAHQTISYSHTPQSLLVYCPTWKADVAPLTVTYTLECQSESSSHILIP